MVKGVGDTAASKYMKQRQSRRLCVAGDNEGENEARSIRHEARHALDGRPRIASGFSVLGQTFPIRCLWHDRGVMIEG